MISDWPKPLIGHPIVGLRTKDSEIEEPLKGDEIKLGLARHLFQTGVKIKDLVRMKLLPRPERLIEQEDFEAMSAYHEDSLQRHQRTTESKKQFRRRIRQMIKKERADGKDI